LIYLTERHRIKNIDFTDMDLKTKEEIRVQNVLPYTESSAGKREQVEQMFDNIAPKYDLLNHLLSMGIDKIWRWKAINIIQKYNPTRILDVATGTGDFALKIKKRTQAEVIGMDISEKMLEVARNKAEKQNQNNGIKFILADCAKIPFDKESFNTVSAAFGVRNFENLRHGLSEMHRILKNNGIILVLELSEPQHFPFKQLYNFYSQTFMPMVGGLISKDKSAYSYLPQSVQAFPYGERFLKLLEEVGFQNCRLKRLSFGIATIYVGEKHIENP